MCMYTCTYTYVCIQSDIQHNMAWPRSSTAVLTTTYVCVYAFWPLDLQTYACVCMYIHVYTHTCVYVCTYTYVCVYVCWPLDIQLYACVDMYIHVCTHTCVYVCTYKYMCVCVCTCAYVYIHVCMNVYIKKLLYIWSSQICSNKVCPKSSIAVSTTRIHTI